MRNRCRKCDCEFSIEDGNDCPRCGTRADVANSQGWQSALFLAILVVTLVIALTR